MDSWQEGERLVSDDRLLDVVDVAKNFSGLSALSGISFAVKRGQIKALIGPNGAGKTTMLNVINGLLNPDSGHVYFQGRDLPGLRPDEIATLGLSRTFQLVRLFTVNNATVLDNVMIGGHLQLMPSVVRSLFRRGRMKEKERSAASAAQELLEFVGLGWAAGYSPTALSFGNQRLLEIARALMEKPQLLLLDEPASGLNEAEVEEFKKLLYSIREKGITILIIEHNMKLVMDVADEIVVLHFGQKLAEGFPSDICSNQAVVEAYLGQNSDHLRGRLT